MNPDEPGTDIPSRRATPDDVPDAGPVRPPAALASSPSLDGLVALEEGMWRADTRYDIEWMRRHVHPDFREVGRSGRTYGHDAVFIDEGPEFEARLPLPLLAVHELAPGVAQLTYDSVVRYGCVIEHGHRSSIWLHDAAAGWRMRFHQGTPFVGEDEVS